MKGVFEPVTHYFRSCNFDLLCLCFVTNTQLILFAVVLNIEFISSMTFLPPEIERNSFLCIITGINMYIFEEKKPSF